MFNVHHNDIPSHLSQVDPSSTEIRLLIKQNANKNSEHNFHEKPQIQRKLRSYGRCFNLGWQIFEKRNRNIVVYLPDFKQQFLNENALFRFYL